MQAEAIELKQFDMLQDDACEQRIVAAKVAPGKRAIILAHHYQRADVYKRADLTGDSLKLLRLASRLTGKAHPTPTSYKPYQSYRSSHAR